MVDFFLLLKLANAGDELQGIKRGIIEMADAIAINKADGLNVKETNLAKTEFTNALHLFPAKESDWIPKVVTCSALDNKGIDSIYKMISEYFSMTKKNGYFYQKRNSQNINWLLETIDNELKNEFYQNNKVQEAMKKFIKMIENQEINPFQAAKEILKIKR